MKVFVTSAAGVALTIAASAVAAQRDEIGPRRLMQTGRKANAPERARFRVNPQFKDDIRKMPSVK